MNKRMTTRVPERASRLAAWTIALAAAVGLAGCADMAGIASKATLRDAAAFHLPANEADAIVVDSRWWTAFGDPQLDRLIDKAIAGNPNLQSTQARLMRAQSAIESAETEVLITNAYFVPHPQLLQALQDAARRGVKVKLVLPSKTDNAVVYHAGRSFYTDLLEAGVRIYERKSRLLHAKSAVIDGVWSTVGSTNLDWRSLAYNDELNAVVLGPEFGAQMQGIFAKDVANSEEITLEKWRSRPFEDRIKEMAAKAWSQLL